MPTSLGVALFNLGRAAEAEPLFRGALAVQVKALGWDNADTALTLNNLAALLQATNRKSEAEPLYVEALAVLTARLGADHPTTRLTAANLTALKAAGEASAPAGD